MLLNCGVGEDSWESLELQKRSYQSILKEISPEWRDWCWSWNSNALATWCDEPTHWKRPLCWERLRAGEEGDSKGWDSWMASSTQWTWVWANSERWWRTGKPGMLQAHGITKSQTWFSEWTTKKLRQLDGSFVNLRMEYNHKHLTNIYWCLQCSRHHLIFYWKCRKKKLD